MRKLLRTIYQVAKLVTGVSLKFPTHTESYRIPALAELFLRTPSLT